MIIKSVVISSTDEMFQCSFISSNNLIYNSHNKQGKTTLIRFIIYGLGYTIPITHPINPEKYTVEIVLSVLDKEIKLIRNKSNLIVKKNDGVKTFSLSGGNGYALKYILSTDNLDLMSNLLGTFYFDQEKGWSLFNRGTVIGSIDYNIYSLIYSLSGLDSKIFEKRKLINKQYDLSKQVMKISISQDSLDEYGQGLITMDENIQGLQKQINSYSSELESHKKIRTSYEHVMKKNDEMWDYIDSLHLAIMHNGESIEISKTNIIGLPETFQLNQHRIEKENAIINNLRNEIKKLQDRMSELLIQQDVDSELIELGVRKSFKVNKELSETNVGILKQHLSDIDEEISHTVEDKNYRKKLDECLLDYCDYLGVSDLLDRNKLILSSDFKSRTGTGKQLLVLAYRCAALTVVSDYLNIRLPIIIDSIKRETDDDNTKTILSFFKEKMPDHQIILSTIEKLDGFENKIDVSYPLLKLRDPCRNIRTFD